MLAAMRNILIVTMSVVLGACGATESQLRSRAAFDFSCPQGQLQITEIDGRSKGVTGCGKRAVYVEQCKPNNASDCTWVLNTELTPEGPPAPAPAQAQAPAPAPAPAPAGSAQTP
jgi:hypothetical protein